MFSNHQRKWILNYWARFILYKSLTQGVPIVHNKCMCWLLTSLQCESYGVWWTFKKIAYKKYCSCIVGTRLIPILFAIHSCGLIIYVPNNEQDPEAWLIQFTIFTYHRLCCANQPSITMISLIPCFWCRAPFRVCTAHAVYFHPQCSTIFFRDLGSTSCTLGWPRSSTKATLV